MSIDLTYILTPFLEERDSDILVGARNEATDYIGPYARIYIDRGWLMIVTDDHEGAAMLNVEALPLVIEALQKLQAKLDA